MAHKDMNGSCCTCERVLSYAYGTHTSIGHGTNVSMHHGTHMNGSLLTCECVCAKEWIGLFWNLVVAVWAERALQYRGVRGIADRDRPHVTVMFSVGLSVM